MYILSTLFSLMVIIALYINAIYSQRYESSLENGICIARSKQVNEALEKHLDSKANAAWTKLQKKAPKNDPAKNKIPRCTRKLHIYNLFRSKEKEEQNKAQRSALQELIAATYQGIPFFDEFTKNDPEVLQSFLNQVIKKADDFAEKKAIEKINDLANLNLQNPDMQEFLYKILKGSEIESNQESGYPPLDKFVSCTKRSQIASVYLAPPEVLRALFPNDDTVSEIIAVRRDLYQSIKDSKNVDSETRDKLEKRFREQFSEALSPNIPKNMVDFVVTKTDPDKITAGKKSDADPSSDDSDDDEDADE